ncbi:hypothetical protein CO2235_150066 [Cupriavidus oxalaticus]|uniref:Uncharacterized protein n=1 Tax=Cupriavidus oxalaticus TaxID=96344 RepID=A0A976G994_9BURK|nr:hypothetical protein CO2235_150066 [Cupriavidus oxalaticus]
MPLRSRPKLPWHDRPVLALAPARTGATANLHVPYRWASAQKHNSTIYPLGHLVRRAVCLNVAAEQSLCGPS